VRALGGGASNTPSTPAHSPTRAAIIAFTLCGDKPATAPIATAPKTTDPATTAYARRAVDPELALDVPAPASANSVVRSSAVIVVVIEASSRVRVRSYENEPNRTEPNRTERNGAANVSEWCCLVHPLDFGIRARGRDSKPGHDWRI